MLGQMSAWWWFQICFIFTPTWGEDPIWLYNIFQMGWKHQLVTVRHVFLLGCCLSWCFLRFYLSSTVSSSSGAHRIVKLGSCWGGWGNQGQNPSYHAPGVYRLCRNYMMLDTFEMAWKRRKRETTSSKALQGSNRNWRLKSLHTKKQNM